MQLLIINSGSDGNCCILTDSNGDQILLDCGLPYNQIMRYARFPKINCVLVSHMHNDHSKSLEKFKNFYVEVITPSKMEDGKIITINNWKILPMKLSHNVECFGFLIYNIIEKKKVAYITDTNYIPKLGAVDILICDCNYDEDIVNEKIELGEKIRTKYYNHCSIQYVKEYLLAMENKPKTFVAYHLSNSNLINICKLEELLRPIVDNLIIAKPNTKFNI